MAVLEEEFHNIERELSKDVQEVTQIKECMQQLSSTELMAWSGDERDIVELGLKNKVKQLITHENEIYLSIQDNLEKLKAESLTLLSHCKSWDKTIGVLKKSYDNEQQKVEGFSKISLDWSALWTILTTRMKNIKENCKELATFEVLKTESLDKMVLLLDKFDLDSLMSQLVQHSILVYEHPGPIAGQKNKGKIILRTFNKMFEPEVKNVSLIQAYSEDVLYTLDLSQEKEIFKSSFERVLGPFLEGKISFNGEEAMNFKYLKRKKTHGASLKLYQFRVQILIPGSNCTKRDEVYEYFSHPFAITTNVSQNPDAWLAVLWDRIVGKESKKTVDWPTFFENLSMFWEAQTGRNLKALLRFTEPSNYQELCLLEEFGKQTGDFMSLAELTNLDFIRGSEKKCSKWQWIYSFIPLLKGLYGNPRQADLLELWNKNFIWGFMTKEKQDQVLRNYPDGYALLRFRLSSVGEIAFCCKKQSRIIPYSWKKEDLADKNKHFTDVLIGRICSMRDSVDSIRLLYESPTGLGRIPLKDLTNRDAVTVGLSGISGSYITGDVRDEEVLPMVEAILKRKMEEFSCPRETAQEIESEIDFYSSGCSGFEELSVDCQTQFSPDMFLNLSEPDNVVLLPNNML